MWGDFSMFHFIRVIIVALVFTISVLVILKAKKTDGIKYYIFLVIASIILYTALLFIPFENHFVSFTSPEDVYNYCKAPIKATHVIYGKNTAMVMSKNGEKNLFMIIPKVENGWQLDSRISAKSETYVISEDITVNIKQYRNTNEFYIFVYDTSKKIGHISDSENSSFTKLNEQEDTLCNTFCAYIEGVNKDYWIEVDGQNICIFDNMCDSEMK